MSPYEDSDMFVVVFFTLFLQFYFYGPFFFFFYLRLRLDLALDSADCVSYRKNISSMLNFSGYG